MGHRDRFKEIKKARKLLLFAKSSPLTLKKREALAIELASYLLSAANQVATREERAKQQFLARMIHDPIGKVFITAMTDQCLRSSNSVRVANQLLYLLHLLGIPKFLPFTRRIQISFFRSFGETFPNLLVPLIKYSLRKETSTVIAPGERGTLLRHIKKRKKEGVNLNLNHLGEAILGEEEASKRLKIYLKDLEDPLIDYISIKISTIYSQLNLIAWEHTLHHLAEKLRLLYRAAMKFKISSGYKFVNLDMEEYRDMHLTTELFMKVLSEKEFLPLSAGIVLQAYLPDSYPLLVEITSWALERIKKGGAPIKVRIVKGANMAMEVVEASFKGWAQAPFLEKIETDANYKKMLLYACDPKHAKVVHIGIASHNLFDIAFALLLCAENGLEKEVSVEMLEGMAEPMRRALQLLVGNILLYCPVATKRDFTHAVSYLMRRLDENTGEENFLSHSFGLLPHTKEWKEQAAFFSQGIDKIKEVEETARRNQNRLSSPKPLPMDADFENEADTDFSLPQNRHFAEKILERWKGETFPSPLPLVIGGKEIVSTNTLAEGFDPSYPKTPLYTYCLSTKKEIDLALTSAKEGEKIWRALGIENRERILHSCSQKLRENRGDLIGAMVADGGKLVSEADVEVSEAIDFAEYYLRSYRHLIGMPDLEWSPKGTILVASPWNFPISIPAGGIFAALITGNVVIFKPAPESVLAGYELAKTLWAGGVPKEVLQWITCNDEPEGSLLLEDPRVNAVILTGATSTAHLFLKKRPGLDLSAETGGKNSMIITAMADRDLAIKDLIQSAFGHSGQKCSAASLAIIEKELYDDLHFRRQLRDAAESLPLGPAWEPHSKITPLIRPANENLLRALTTLEAGESWLLKPKQDKENLNLWSPGIKLGVKKGSFTQQTELFGPILGMMRAEDLGHAIHLANSTPYGLTAGIHTLDRREQLRWQQTIIAGNCYINRTITGAIVKRQPFGGCKQSGFGRGAKAGGPNYLTQFMHAKQKGIPKEKFPAADWVNNLTHSLDRFDLSAEELGIWYASISSYAFFWQQMKREKEMTKVIGQDNFLRYVTRKKITLRIGPKDPPLDYLRSFAAALTTEARIDISWEHRKEEKIEQINWEAILPFFNITYETEEQFIKKVEMGHVDRIRILYPPSDALKKACSIHPTYIDDAPVLANGRIELLHYLREVSTSIDYHRYGNLGLREGELRRSSH
ncbi:MAG: bifunctional proline dehydrogenase/L-glutamate gamma-semialdehyde dehydrogenase [Candidatus Doudnabacteria bacterium]|nr:bifunctional proline dehydrogenase/L-glutamate gamma-semialdehyde dehydrogenase [Candidatus Doudnabacteria bacterium]